MRFLFVLTTLFALFIFPPILWAEPAIVYTGSVDDSTYNYSLHQGIQEFRMKSGKKCLEIKSASDGSEYLNDVLRCIEEGHSPILFPYSSQFHEIIDIARAHRGTDFIFLDYGKDVDLPNAWSFLFADHEGAFLAGALAALMTQTKTVGFVYVSDDYPVLLRFRAGYAQGVLAVDPDIRILHGVLEDYPGVWRDTKKGGEVAADLIAQGADVLFAAAGFAGTGVLAQAAEQGVYAIGVDVNQNNLHPGTMIGSMVKRSDKAVYVALSLALSGIRRDGIKRLGLAQDAVSIDFDGVEKNLVPEEVRQQLEKMKSEILLGKRQVKNHD